MSAADHLDNLREELADKIAAASEFAYFGNRDATAKSADALREATRAFGAFADFIAGFIMESPYVTTKQIEWFGDTRFEQELLNRLGEDFPTAQDILEFEDDDRPCPDNDRLANHQMGIGFGFINRW